MRAGVKGPFTPIEVPGALATLATGIDDRGRITGLYGHAEAGLSSARIRRHPSSRPPWLPVGLGDRGGTR